MARTDEFASEGVLLVGHGTRDAEGLAEFRAAARQLAGRLAPRPVEACFLELAEPTIAEGVDRLAARGVRRLTVAPLLLLAAGHAKRDIPEAVAAATARHPQLAWRQAPHLGLEPRIVELSVRRYREATAVGGAADVADAETLLVLVGRGSSDAEALAEFEQFARRRFEAAPCGRLEIAYTALAEPPLETALSRAAEGAFRRIVIQPHLLFGGALVRRVAECVAAVRATSADRQWLLTGHLGPDPSVVDAAAARIGGS